jgi:hypothetical protein
MPLIKPLSAAHRPARAQHEAIFWPSVKTKSRIWSTAPLILLLAVLAAAEIGLHPSVAQLCGQAADFPCGP